MTIFIFAEKVRRKAGISAAKRATAKSKKAAIQKNPLVEFDYPSSKSPVGERTHRFVRLISATPRYITGLEIIPTEAGQTYHFKKFTKEKMRHVQVLEFNPGSMS